MTDRDDTINRPFDASDVATFAADADAHRRFIAARATDSLSYGDLVYAQAQGWCPSSPDGMGPHRPDDTTEPPTCAECGAEIGDCPECGDPLTVEGSGDGTGDPVHVFCDLCGKAEHPADLTPDWNGETGNHRSCERNAR